MGAQLKMALKEAGVKPKRESGHLKRIVEYLRVNDCSQQHPCEVPDIASVVQLAPEKVSQALSNAFTKSSLAPLRRTTSAVPGSRWAYYWDDAEHQPETLSEAVEAVRRAQRQLERAIDALVQISEKPRLPKHVRDALKGML